ncbi:MAG TPA: DUF937 domain-containing protein [Hymenobacter sp.]|jgi:hypothetical protein
MNILDTIKATFSPKLVGHIAARMGECEKGINNALDGIVPVVLGGLINQAASGRAEEVFELSQKAYRATNVSLASLTGVLGILGSGSALERGEKLLLTLFGTASQVMANSISDYAGIKVSSAATLLNMVSAVLPAELGQYAIVHHLKARGFAEALLSLKGTVRTMLPPGLYGLTCLVWLGGLVTAPAQPVIEEERVAAMVQLEATSVVRAVVHWWQGVINLVRFT